MTLHFLLSTLLLDMEHDATDRFMRDTICCCYGAERFLLLHHTVNDHRPVFRGNTVCRVFRSWSSVLDNWRIASLKEFFFCQKVLHLEIQFTRRGKQEGANW